MQEKTVAVSTGERPSHVGPETETMENTAVQNEVCFFTLKKQDLLKTAK